MKALKVILGIIVVIIGSFLILCMVADENFDVREEKKVAVSKEFAMNYLADLEKFHEWSPWTHLDPNEEWSVENNGEVGAKYSWKGNDQVGEGYQEITSIGADRIDFKITFVKPMEDQGEVFFEVHEAGEDSVTIAWGYHSELAFIARGFVAMMGAVDMLKGEYIKGLDNLKPMIESDYASYLENQSNVKEVELPRMTYLAKRSHVAMQEIGAFFGKELPALFTVSQAKELVAKTAPCGLYFGAPNNDSTEVAAAMGFAAVEPIKGYELIEVPATKALQLDYYGAYENMESGLMELHDYADKKGYQISNMHIEEYVTDPSTVTDTAQWLTKITFVIE